MTIFLTVLMKPVGPGKGTLMKEILNTAKSFPAFEKALTIHMVEISEAMRKIQRDALVASVHSPNESNVSASLYFSVIPYSSQLDSELPTHGGLSHLHLVTPPLSRRYHGPWHPYSLAQFTPRSSIGSIRFASILLFRDNSLLQCSLVTRSWMPSQSTSL